MISKARDNANFDDEPTVVIGAAHDSSVNSEEPEASRDLFGEPAPDLSAAPVAAGWQPDYFWPVSGQSNSFVAASLPALNLLVQVRAANAHDNVEELRGLCEQYIQNFQELLSKSTSPQDVRDLASYALCSALDEAVLTTSWGANSNWSNQSLLSQFHGDVWGGERFFENIDALRKNGNKNAELIAFYLLLIDLGFEGQFRVQRGGDKMLEQLRRDLGRRFRRGKPAPVSSLLVGKADAGRKNRIRRYVPIWVVASVAALILAGGYVFFEERYKAALAPIFQKFVAIADNPLAPVRLDQ